MRRALFSLALLALLALAVPSYGQGYASAQAQAGVPLAAPQAALAAPAYGTCAANALAAPGGCAQNYVTAAPAVVQAAPVLQSYAVPAQQVIIQRQVVATPVVVQRQVVPYVQNQVLANVGYNTGAALAPQQRLLLGRQRAQKTVSRSRAVTVTRRPGLLNRVLGR